MRSSEHGALPCEYDSGVGGECGRTAARKVTMSESLSEGAKVKNLCVDHYIYVTTDPKTLVVSVQRINYR